MKPKSNLFTKNGKSLVSKVIASNNIKKDIEKAVELIGGFKKIIKKGDIVLLKPNYVYDTPFPATTSLDFLKAVIELVYKNGAKKVIVGESSVYWQNTRKIMESLGVFNIAQETKSEVHIFDEHEYVKADIKDAKYKTTMRYPKILDEADKLIFLPCLKTHSSARFTASLKLAIGCTHKTERLAHFSHLEPKIAELSSIIFPDLCIMDARKVFVTGGPGHGDVESPNIIMASGDRIAMDVEGVKILQSFNARNKLTMNAWELPTIKRAVELKLGSKSEKDYKVIQ